MILSVVARRLAGKHQLLGETPVHFMSLNFIPKGMSDGVELRGGSVRPQADEPGEVCGDVP